MMPDLTPIIGWETGRASEPAFMDMNLHSVRDGARQILTGQIDATKPPVVLYQFDLSDPMNPHGLLIAYAEEQTGVKPVCSDFDTFTVGSKGMSYAAMKPEQVCARREGSHTQPRAGAALWPVPRSSVGALLSDPSSVLGRSRARVDRSASRIGRSTAPRSSSQRPRPGRRRA